MVVEQSILEQMLHCAENIQQCNDYLKKGSHDVLYTLVGVMDWAGELQRLNEERRRWL